MPERPTTPIPTEDLLAAYELNLLEDDERARLEAALITDPELLEDLYDGAPEALALQADPGRFARAAAHGAALAAHRRSWLTRIMKPWVLAPLAGALAVVAVLLLPIGPDSDLARLAILEPLPSVQVELRSGAQTADTTYQAAMADYRAEQWSAAAAGFVAALAAAEPGWPRTDQARLYGGSSLLMSGQPEAAIPPLEAASGSSLAPIREQALWQLAQAQLTLDRGEAARPALEALQSSPVFGERARAVLDELASR